MQNPTDAKVLKNKTAEFRIAVTNTGDGPARNVIVQAKLSPGLRHDTGERNEDNSFELPIPQIGPGQREELDPLTVDATQGGAQWCKVSAKSTDVVFVKEEAEVTRTIEVVEPKLKLTLTGPDKRFTDTVAPYAITLENLGDAPARNVRVLVTLGVSGRLVADPPGRQVRHRLAAAPVVDPPDRPGEKPRTLPFEVRMGGISAYEVNVEARGRQRDPPARIARSPTCRACPTWTSWSGNAAGWWTSTAPRRSRSACGIMAPRRPPSSRSRRISRTTWSWIRRPAGRKSRRIASPDLKEVKFPIIERLGPGKEVVLAIKVKVTKPSPKIGTCRVKLTHDELSEPLEDMAGVKVTEVAAGGGDAVSGLKRGCQMPDSGCRMPDPDAKFQIPDAGFGIQHLAS